jgi:hypothetical protein
LMPARHGGGVLVLVVRRVVEDAGLALELVCKGFRV